MDSGDRPPQGSLPCRPSMQHQLSPGEFPRRIQSPRLTPRSTPPQSPQSLRFTPPQSPQMHSDALGTLLDGLHADELRQVLLRLAAMSGESGRVAAETSVLAQLQLRDVMRDVMLESPTTSPRTDGGTPKELRRLRSRCDPVLGDRTHRRSKEVSRRGGLTPLYSLILDDSRSHAARRRAPAVPMFVTLPDSVTDDRSRDRQ
jgi:hypothetical protein